MFYTDFAARKDTSFPCRVLLNTGIKSMGILMKWFLPIYSGFRDDNLGIRSSKIAQNAQIIAGTFLHKHPESGSAICFFMKNYPPLARSGKLMDNCVM
jgi:hypothetical protein